MSEGKTFTQAVVACLIANAPDELETRRSELMALVSRVLDELSKEDAVRLSPQPSREQIQQYLAHIRSVLPAKHDRIALIAGGATKIKGYVFEAPKLPEIRGASALLDWVNESGLNKLWFDRFEVKDAEPATLHPYIIYASGGGFLAFTPADLGEEMAGAVERCYTAHTLTANSVAVAGIFSLLELRYGRLAPKNDRIDYWIDDFLRHWEQPKLRRQLASYYYGSDDELPANRFYNRKSFGELVTLLATMTSRRRDERATHGDTRSRPFYQMMPWAEKCQTSGVRPAVVVGEGLPDTPALSQTAARKAYVGRKMKKPDGDYEWYTKVFGSDVELPVSWEERFKLHAAMTAYYGDLAKEHVDPAQDVGEIAQASIPGGYIGVIYADGNNVGRLVATHNTPKQYTQTSELLTEAAQHAVLTALTRHLRPAAIKSERGVRKWVHPFEILTIGGDDLFIIVPGSKTLEIASTIGREFEIGLQTVFDTGKALSTATVRGRYRHNTPFTDKPYTPAIGLSAGMIIAQENAPIFFLRDLVEELLKSAKQLAKDNAKNKFYGGAVDFMVMKSITMVTDKIASFRKQALGDDGDQSKRRLTARPYTWHEFAGLLQTVQALKQAGVPRSQLYRLRRVLDEEQGGVIASVMEYLYTRARMDERTMRALLEHIENPWCAIPSNGGRGGLPPWMPLSKGGWETIWSDVLEVYEMLPEQTKE